jgi:hypothetical protein
MQSPKASSTRGGAVDLDARRKTCMSVMKKLPSVLQGSDETAFLDHKKGRVRSRWMRRVHACRKGGRRRSEATAWFSSSPQIGRVLPPPPRPTERDGRC